MLLKKNTTISVLFCPNTVLNRLQTFCFWYAIRFGLVYIFITLNYLLHDSQLSNLENNILITCGRYNLVRYFNVLYFIYDILFVMCIWQFTHCILTKQLLFSVLNRILDVPVYLTSIYQSHNSAIGYPFSSMKN